MPAVAMSQRHGEKCPLDSTLAILRGKWKSIILCRLMKKEMRFTELLRTLPGCTRRMLSMQLEQLLTDKIIKRQVDTNFVPTKTSYSLTGLGQSLVPIILAMDQWGSDYLQQLE